MEDVHKETAAQIFDKPAEDVTPSERHFGKMVNFSVVLGSGISRERILKYVEKSGIDRDELVRQAKEIAGAWDKMWEGC